MFWLQQKEYAMTTNGLKVVSAARKLILAVPATDRIVAFPQGATISEYGQNNDAPAIVVQNLTDPSQPWQGADSENGIVIMNEVSEANAELLLDMVDGTIMGLDAIITKARELGIGDVYTTTRSFVEAKLTPAGRMINPFTGVVKRDDRDVCNVYRDAEGVLQIVVNDEPRRIEPDILLRTYRNADGSEIDLTDVPMLL
jgi:hypothetical protein